MALKKRKYYTTDRIDATGAYYRVIYGERSDGKTYSVLLGAVKRYWEAGKQMAYVRRWDEDIKGKRARELYNSIVENGEISRLTGGKWNDIHYNGGRWFLSYTDGKNRLNDETPLAYAFSISAVTHDKSISYPNVTTILFDEFIDRRGYLTDEFSLFMNVLSTIIRDRDDVVIYMCGNTVNKFCPYFNEMGLNNVKKQKKGAIDLYRYGESNLTVAVEYSKGSGKVGKASDVYFAFDNPKLKMITEGAWEINVYPRTPHKIRPKDILYKYFIHFDHEWLQANIVNIGNDLYTYIHPCREPTDKDSYLIYSQDFSVKPNYVRFLSNPHSKIERKIYDFYAKDKIFYSDNDTGEVVRNYLMWSSNE